MTGEWKFFIQDIYDAIQHIKEFVGTMKQREFLADNSLMKICDDCNNGL